MNRKRSKSRSLVWPSLALGLSLVGLAAACAPSAAPERPAPSPSDCFAALAEPDDIDCHAVEPIRVEALERRRAVAECLQAVNHAALENKRDETLSVNRLAPAALPTVTFSTYSDEAQTYPRDRLVAVSSTTVHCAEPNLYETIVARDVNGQLVQVDFVPEFVRIREVDSCSCNGCGPDPGPPLVEYAVLPAGQKVDRKILVKWPVQALRNRSPPCS